MPAASRNERVTRRLKLHNLNILLAVAETGSMGKAANRLSISQPAVSKAIVELENAVGFRLLERSRRGVEPTPYGHALLKRGTAIFDELRQGLNDIVHLSDPTAGEVRIGTTEAAAAAMVASVITELSRQYPRMQFHVVTSESAKLLAELDARNVELVVHRVARHTSDECSAEILFYDAPVIVAGAKNPLARRRNIALTELMDEPWVLMPFDSHAGSMQVELFRASGVEPPRPTVATSSYALRTELLATQHFVTVMTGFSLLLLRRHADLKALAVKLPVPPDPVGIVTLKNRSLGPAAQLFTERLRALVRPRAKGADKQ